MLGCIRSLKPTVHNARIGELFRYLNLSVTHSEGTNRKDMSSTGNGASDHTSSACVATLSKIFQSRCESHVVQKLDSRSSLLIAPPLTTSPPPLSSRIKSQIEKRRIRLQRSLELIESMRSDIQLIEKKKKRSDIHGRPPFPAPLPEP